jgi:cell division protein FtsN
MKIARHIGDLLYDYECVVIPGLGGFLTSDKPASIQANTHHFHPPYKQVMFNAYLKANDGLLVNYIAREENISYNDAKAQVDKFVYLCDNALKSGKRINFHKVGSLFLNKNEKIVFEQDSAVNYNADAFGLTGFVSPAIRRTNAEERLREVVGASREAKTTAPKETKKQNRKEVSASETAKPKHAKLLASRSKSPYKTQLVFLVALVVAMMVGWGFMNKDTVNTYYNNYSSVIPLFYSQPNAYVINNIDKVPIAKISSSSFGSWWISLFEKSETNKSPVAVKKVMAKVKKPEAVSVRPEYKSSTPVVKKTTNTITAPAKSENKVAELPKTVSRHLSKKMTAKPVPVKRMMNSPQFFIIAGAFRDTRNVRALIRSLKNKGFNPLVAGENTYGWRRVAFGVFNNRSQAEKQLRIIREKENPAAWILVK